MKRPLLIVAWALMLFPLAAAAMMAAPDPTPTLRDRLLAFDNVVVATLPADFDQQPESVASSNSVSLVVNVTKVLKRDLKTEPCSLHVHEQLPALLRMRDGKCDGAYLLVLRPIRPNANAGTLMGGFLGTDLARFIPADESLLRLVPLLLKSESAKADDLAKLVAEQIAAKDVSAATVAVLADTFTTALNSAEIPEKSTLAKTNPAWEKAYAGLLTGGAKGCAPDCVAQVWCLAQTKTNLGFQAKLGPGLTQAVRKWLTDAASAQFPNAVPPNTPKPDAAAAARARTRTSPTAFSRDGSALAAIELLTFAKDVAAQTALVTLATQTDYPPASTAARDALPAILGPEKAQPILDSLPPLRRPGRQPMNLVPMN
ncbi:MAG: hypothetical protein WCI73_03815 [Phycisphaerae bacterium]